MGKKEALQKKWDPGKFWTAQGVNRRRNEEEPGRQQWHKGTRLKAAGMSEEGHDNRQPEDEAGYRSNI
jgi:hypothetical protein